VDRPLRLKVPNLRYLVYNYGCYCVLASYIHFFKCCASAHGGSNMTLRQYVEYLIDREIAATIKKYLKEHDPQGLEKFENEIEKQEHANLSKTQASSSVANDTSSPTSSPSITPGHTPGQSRTDVNIDIQALEMQQQDASALMGS